MTLKKNVEDAIRKNLPEETAGLLKKRLDELEAIEKQSERDRKKIEELEAVNRDQAEELEAIEKQLAKLREDIAEYKAVAAANLETQRTLGIRYAVLEERERQVYSRLADLKEVTLAVFQNNRFKYREEKDVPVAVPGVPGYKDQWDTWMPERQPEIRRETETKEVDGES